MSLVPPKNLQQQLLERLADERTTRDDIATIYAQALHCGGTVDWLEVNSMILDRWSSSGLAYIKRQAWGQADEPRSLSFLIGQLEGAILILGNPAFPLDRVKLVALLREIVEDSKEHRG